MWGVFSRAFFISCALRARDSQGVRIGTARRLGSAQDAITLAVQWWKPGLKKKAGPFSPFDEPPWTTPGKLLDLMSVIGASNATAVATVISKEPQSFKDLKAARNFFAHRSHSAADELKKVARNQRLSVGLRPADLVCSRAPGRLQNLLADWIDDVRDATQEMSL